MFWQIFMKINGMNKFLQINTIFLKKGVDSISQRRILNRPPRTDLQTTADGSKREREGRDEGRKRY